MSKKLRKEKHTHTYFNSKNRGSYKHPRIGLNKSLIRNAAVGPEYVPYEFLEQLPQVSSFRFP